MTEGKKIINTVLFDLDGVIIDSNEAIIRSWRAAAECYNYTITNDMVKNFIIGASPEFTLNNLFPKENRETKQAIHDIVNKLEEESECCFIPGVDIFLKSLSQFNLNIGMVTSSWPEKINNVLKKGGLDMFSHIVSRVDVSRGKPSPEPYCVAMKHFSSNPKETLVFEDSVNGITSAVGAGAECVAVGNSDNLKYYIHKVSDFRGLNVTNDAPDYIFPKTDFGIKILSRCAGKVK